MAGDKWMSVQQALEWAFGKEGARLEMRDPEPEARGFGLEYVLMEQARLGVRVDVFRGQSYPHEDADAIAAVVQHVSAGFGMAAAIAGYAIAGSTPDWMPGAAPKLEPKAWKRNSRFQRYGKAERLGEYVEHWRAPHPRNPAKTVLRRKRVDIMWTPCRWRPSIEQIESARREYGLWVDALAEIRDNLKYLRMAEIRITEALPPPEPWKNMRKTAAIQDQPPSVAS